MGKQTQKQQQTPKPRETEPADAPTTNKKIQETWYPEQN